MTERLGEEALIARFFAPLATDPGALALRDDAATFRAPDGADLVLTTDALVAGVHFFPDDPPDLIARKALRVNLSDLAAKGATPSGYLLTLALTENWTVAWLEAFARGLAEDQRAYGISLLGGDTVKTPGPVTISIAAIGAVPAGRAVRRTGARVGDAVLLTGGIGDAMLGCRLRAEPALAEGLDPALVAGARRRYLLPEPRVALAPVILDYATASMDVSDGFAGDLAKLCRASGVGARADVESIPLDFGAHALAMREPSFIVPILTGGDDYELLFTVENRDDRVFEALRACAAVGVEAHWVGDIVDGEGVTVMLQGRPLGLGAGGYSHF